MENETQDFGLADFESALFEDDYQIDDDTGREEEAEAETKEEPQDTQEQTAPEAESGPESEESEKDETTPEEAKAPAEDGQKPDSQTFTLKVNKEDRTVTLEEMTAYAQKGMDYDRVKEQNAQLRQANEALQGKLDGAKQNQEAVEILEELARKSGLKVDQLAQTLYINYRKSGGATEETARAELKSARLEKELNAVKAKQTQEQGQENAAEARAKRDLEQFRQDYPEVALTEELVDKLVPDVQGGMSLSAAYRKLEKAQDEARIAELERKLAAKAQNDRNKRSSPGSQQDSGGRANRSDYEEFERALFG